MSMVQVISDSFPYTVGTALTASGNWAKPTGQQGLEVGAGGNCAIPIDNNVTDFNYNTVSVMAPGGTFPNDQYAEVTASLLTGVNFDRYAGAMARLSSAGGAITGYQFLAGQEGPNKVYYIQKYVAGTKTTIKSGTLSSVNPGDVFRIMVVGTTITIYQNGSLIDTETDSSVASGQPGLCAFTDSGTIADAKMTLFAAGANRAATPTFSPVAGTYTGTQTVTITSATGGSTIYYTTDGTTPTESSSSISNGGTVSVASSLTLKAIASLTNNVDSAVASAAYNLTVAQRASDNFQRASGPTNSPLGPNWSLFSDEPGGALGIQIISSGDVAPTSSAQTGFPVTLGEWVGSGGGQPFGNDQMASFQIAAIAPEQSVVAITAASQSGSNTTYTYTLTSGAALQNPQEIIVSGMGHAGNNGNFLISGLGTGTFTVPNASGVTATESGTGITPTDSLGNLTVRMNAATQTGYYCFVGNNSAYVAQGDGTVPDNRLYCRELWDVVGGTNTDINLGTGGNYIAGGSTNYNPIPDTVGDVYTLMALADKICLFKNNVIVAGAVDTTITGGGAPGIGASSAQGSGHTMPLGANVGVTGFQTSLWSGQDMPLTPAGWSRKAHDSFNANSGSVNASNWTPNTAYNHALQCLNNTVTGTAAQNSSGIWTGRSWANNQSSTVVNYSATGNTSVAVLVRAVTGAQTFYIGQFTYTSGLGTGNFTLYNCIAGTFTAIGAGTAAGTFNFGDVMRLEANGTTITLYKNGVSVLSGTDTNIASGSPGVYANGNTVGLIYWEGDEIASSNAATPTASPAAGSYGPTQTVSLSSSTSGAYIYYTTDGSAPTTSSTLYTGPITVSTSQTIKAIAVAGGFLTSSTLTAAYTINGTAATPTFSPVAGSYSSTQSVTISSTTPSNTIYYTTDGSTPTTGSTQYSGPVSVSSSLTLKAIATAAGFSNSAVGSAAYTITGGGVAYSQPDCRVTKPNSATGEVQNGTTLYDSQTSSNPAIPPTDSRVSKPVASGTYPQNSRNPAKYTS